MYTLDREHIMWNELTYQISLGFEAFNTYWQSFWIDLRLSEQPSVTNVKSAKGIFF